MVSYFQIHNYLAAQELSLQKYRILALKKCFFQGFYLLIFHKLINDFLKKGIIDRKCISRYTFKHIFESLSLFSKEKSEF